MGYRYKTRGRTADVKTAVKAGFIWALLAGTVLLSGCATPPADPAARAQFEATNDPLEPTNRVIFGFNDTLDTYLFRPIAIGYRDVVPEFGRDRIRHFLDNLNEPVVFANDLLQGNITRAGETLGRFTINTTAGGLGFFDAATGQGYRQQPGDFGQTLHVYGVSEGPYLVLPILGPSNPRDAFGGIVDTYTDPFFWVTGNTAQIVRSVVNGVDQRSRVIEPLDDLKKESIDYYAELRSISRQHRAAEIGEKRPSDDIVDELYNDPENQQASAPVANP